MTISLATDDRDPLKRGSMVVGVRVHPDTVDDAGAFTVDCPTTAQIVGSTTVFGIVVIWVHVPYASLIEMQRRRFYLLPGNKMSSLCIEDAAYLGTHIVGAEEGPEHAQDWHLFADIAYRPSEHEKQLDAATFTVMH